MVNDILAQARLLDNDEQIALVKAGWDGVGKLGATSPMTPAQKAELDRRLAAKAGTTICPNLLPRRAQR